MMFILRLISSAITLCQLVLLRPLTHGIEVRYIDIGASSFEKPKFSLAFSKVKSAGFEPDDRSKEDFTTPSKLGDFDLFPVGLADVDEELSLYLTKKSHCSSLLKPIKDGDSRYDIVGTVPVTCRRLDGFNLVADLVKIDVQGAEQKVISGGLETIKQAVVLECELFVSEAYEGQTRLDTLVRLLESVGFSLIGPSAVYRDPANIGKVEFVDLVFVNERLLVAQPDRIFILLAHASERNYLKKLNLVPNLAGCTLFQRGLIKVIRTLDFVKPNLLLGLRA